MTARDERREQPVRVIVMGGSAGGLIAGLLLTRAGHVVTVLERDDLRPAADVETAAATAFRAAAPHIVQPHTMLATCRRLLREELPDVYAALVAAGAVEAALSTQMPPTLSDRSAARDDEDLALMMTRRATVDWVLRRAAAGEPGLDVRHGVVVTGLVADPGAPPRVRGVRTAGGDLLADVVVDALGRRTPLDRWLAAIGAAGAATSSAECGLAYYSRQYRVRAGVTPPAPTTTRLVLGLDEFNVGIWGADSDTMQIALAPLAADRRFTAARDPAVFTAVLRSLPVFAAWLDVLEPLTDVAVMGGLHNTLRRLVVDGAPVAVGVHAVGDAVCTTNPTFGRGLGMVLRTAVGLRDALAVHPDAPEAQARALDAVVERYVAPFYADQAATDAARLAVLRHAVLGGPAPSATPEPHRVTFGELRQAARTDPVAFRGVWRLMGMVGRPSEVYEAPDVVRRVRAASTDAPAAVLDQPTHDELTALLAGSPLGTRGRVLSA